MLGLNDNRRRHHDVHRSRALENGNDHRERGGRDRPHAARAGNNTERKPRKEKKVKVAEPGSHL